MDGGEDTHISPARPAPVAAVSAADVARAGGLEDRERRLGLTEYRRAVRRLAQRLHVTVGDLARLSQQQDSSGARGGAARGSRGAAAEPGAQVRRGDAGGQVGPRARQHHRDARGTCSVCIERGSPFPARFMFAEVLAVFRRGLGLMTCATCEGQNDVLWLLEDYDALKACSRCGAMLVCLCVDM